MKVNLMPMAGEGKRFFEGGYNVPKPFIDVFGIPMAVRAAQALPAADKWIFVCRKEHITDFQAEAILSHYFPSAVIIPVEKTTDGQASTCMLAASEIPEDAILTIAPADEDMTYDRARYSAMMESPDVDALVWTFRHNPAVLKKPDSYGWVKLLSPDHSLMESLSCKKAISDTPMDDHAVSGVFSFKKASIFFDAVARMRRENRRVNNEFYVDVAMDCIRLNGGKVHAFEVDDYICWGTPEDLERYYGEVNSGRRSLLEHRGE